MPGADTLVTAAMADGPKTAQEEEAAAAAAPVEKEKETQEQAGPADS
jgi:hypothetical protein